MVDLEMVVTLKGGRHRGSLYYKTNRKRLVPANVSLEGWAT